MSLDEYSILEYLYIDKSRLGSYFEQISDPVAFDKVPVWKVIFGFAGPKVEAEQIRPGRAYTKHEKIIKLINYAKEKNLLSNQRPNHPFRNKRQFTIESMEARRVHIPAKAEVPNFNGLSVWVSVKPDDHIEDIRHSGFGPLFLIEDFVCKDDNDDRHRYSSYSSLELLIDTLDKQTVLSIFQIESKRDLNNSLRDSFESNPIDALTSMGAKFGPSRRIRSLYRVRSACMEKGVATIAYPIVIFDESGAQKIGA